jgi:hypothetical protein
MSQLEAYFIYTTKGLRTVLISKKPAGRVRSNYNSISAMDPAAGLMSETAFFANGSYDAGFLCRAVGAIVVIWGKKERFERKP